MESYSDESLWIRVDGWLEEYGDALKEYANISLLGVEKGVIALEVDGKLVQL